MCGFETSCVCCCSFPLAFAFPDIQLLLMCFFLIWSAYLVVYILFKQALLTQVLPVFFAASRLLLEMFLFYLFTPVCGTCKSQGSCLPLVISGGWTQQVSLGGKGLYPLSHPTGQEVCRFGFVLFFIFCSLGLFMAVGKRHQDHQWCPRQARRYLSSLPLPPCLHVLLPRVHKVKRSFCPVVGTEGQEPRILWNKLSSESQLSAVLLWPVLRSLSLVPTLPASAAWEPLVTAWRGHGTYWEEIFPEYILPLCTYKNDTIVKISTTELDEGKRSLNLTINRLLCHLNIFYTCKYM